jgi:hypothetical protein
MRVQSYFAFFSFRSFGGVRELSGFTWSAAGASRIFRIFLVFSDQVPRYAKGDNELRLFESSLNELRGQTKVAAKNTIRLQE